MKKIWFPCPGCNKSYSYEEYKKNDPKDQVTWSENFKCPFCEQKVFLKYSKWRTVNTLILLLPLVISFSFLIEGDSNIYIIKGLFFWGSIVIGLMGCASSKNFLLAFEKEMPSQFSIMELLYFTNAIALILMAVFTGVAWPVQVLYGLLWMKVLWGLIQKKSEPKS